MSVILKFILRAPLILDLPLSYIRMLHSWTRKRWTGKDPCAHSRDHAVYVHFDRRGMVHDYVLYQLRELVNSGFRVTFVTNSRRFNTSSVSAVSPYCREILWRHNTGYDFGAYKAGIGAIGDLDAVDRLLLMNDSVYGPFYPLSKLLADIDVRETDIWGITDSWEYHYHVHSYFILFLKGALQSPAFRRFWRWMPYYNSKFLVIYYGEIRLTHVLAQRKLRVNVLYPYWDTAKAVLERLERVPEHLSPVHQAFLDQLKRNVILGRPLNQMHYFVETLLTDFGCPFVKRELIAANPVAIPYNWRWSELIKENTEYDPALIYRHLQAL